MYTSTVYVCKQPHKSLIGEQAWEDLHLQNEWNKAISLDLQSCSWEVICSNQTVIDVYLCSQAEYAGEEM